MMLLAVVLLASTQGYGPVAPTQGYVPVDFDTVVSTLLRQEMATGGAALARHLRPVLAGRGAVWAQRRRDALDSVSQPIAVLMQSLADAGVDAPAARWLDSGTVLPAARLRV